MYYWKLFLDIRRNQWADSFRVHHLQSLHFKAWTRLLAVQQHHRETKYQSSIAQQSLLLRRNFKVLLLRFLFIIICLSRLQRWRQAFGITMLQNKFSRRLLSRAFTNWSAFTASRHVYIYKLIKYHFMSNLVTAANPTQWWPSSNITTGIEYL